jgi:hypothetical protein
MWNTEIVALGYYIACQVKSLLRIYPYNATSPNTVPPVLLVGAAMPYPVLAGSLRNVWYVTCGTWYYSVELESVTPTASLHFMHILLVSVVDENKEDGIE